MFEEKVMWKMEDRRLKIEDRRLKIVPRSLCVARPPIFNPRWLAVLLTGIILAFLPGASSAQQDWYYHTIHSNSLAVQYGRTVKLTYANQASRTRQFKVSLYYIYDKFDLGEDQVKSDMYNLNLEFQYHLMRFGKTFVNGHAGFGGYHLKAKNSIDQKHDETKFSFIGGFQGEYFLQKGAFAVVFDYDVLLTPWSDVYEFLHLPRIGLGWTF
ncbi:MAG: hypothetical protein ACREOO_02670 [bacterium]